MSMVSAPVRRYHGVPVEQWEATPLFSDLDPLSKRLIICKVREHFKHLESGSKQLLVAKTYEQSENSESSGASDEKIDEFWREHITPHMSAAQGYTRLRNVLETSARRSLISAALAQ